MMAITTREDYILCELEKMEMSTGRCEKTAEHIVSTRISTELDTLALQIQTVQRAVREEIERMGKTPLQPDQPIAESGGGK